MSSSRICVKGLRKHTKEQDLREAFGKKGEVTDVRLMKTKDGKSRQFAFIGFRTEAQAAEAQSYFTGTFVDSAKVVVEIAKRIGDDTLKLQKQQHGKKHESGKGFENDNDSPDKVDPATQKKNKGNGNNQSAVESAISLEKSEFLETSKPRSQTKFWANDTTSDVLNEASQKSEEINEINDNDSQDGSSEVNDFSGRSKNIITTKKVTSDLDYLKSKVTSFSDDESDETEDGDVEQKKCALEDEDNTNNMKTLDNNADEENDGDEEDTSRIFVRNLPFSCVEDELKAFFLPFGRIVAVHLPLDDQKIGKGFGFVQFMLPEEAENAIKETDGVSFQGRVVRVIRAKRARDEIQEGVILDKNGKPLSSYQVQKEADRRSNASKMDGWNASFVRSEAVIESIAERYGLKASDIMDTTEAGGEMAVRLAIAESKVIQENRDYFTEHGVSIDVLESQSSSQRAHERSSTTLLVKNLTKDVVQKDLEQMFARFGNLAAFLIPPSRTVALVDFLEPSEARAAFKGLAYRRYNHTPLYLEWAPLNVIDNAKQNENAKIAQLKLNARDKKQKDSDLDVEEDVSAYQCLFLKNLNFSTEEEDLEKHLIFVGAGSQYGLRAVSIPKKTSSSGVPLSMGFGFVEFSTSTQCKDAIIKLDKSTLQGHLLEAKPSDKQLSASAKLGATQNTKKSDATLKKTKSQDLTNCKLIVRNVAFQATQNELRSLFATFGNVKRVRIPKKIEGNHRGFAFVEFSTPQEAASAMNSLGSTHFYGRHLVLEWAKAESESVQELRKRAGGDTKAMKAGSKRQKIEEDAFE